MDKFNPAALSGARVGLTDVQPSFYHFYMLTILKEPSDF